ncbi:hypothetical protein [Ruminococcus sp.]|uniref:hypothetical protein n=1 Tax=Ruminococcus sp. TaxID=41978 RepID=UPI0025D6402C|nr:hypothetical protein [Ruminococcus sp.]MBQ8967304.1 hypothetical protein [Ruminococcus sp.]
MGSFGGRLPEIEEVSCMGRTGFVKSGVIFTVRGGLGKLRKKWIDEDEWASQGVFYLGDTPLVQFDGGVSSTTPYLLAAGYGIENADSEELRAIDTAINSPFADVEHSFKDIRPLLGLLEDGCYLLADAEVTPTDGEGRFFWDIDPHFSGYSCTARDYYLGEVRGLGIYSTVHTDPIYLYPSQSAALFNRERAEHYVELFTREKEPPRAIAYNIMGGMALLLDGHHKAAAAAKLGIPLKCLLIIKGRAEYEECRGRTAERIKFTEDIYFARKKTDECIEDIISSGQRSWEELPKIAGYEEIRYRRREWEKEYLVTVGEYPAAEERALEKYFGLHRRYDEAADHLEENVSDEVSLRKYLEEDPLGLGSRVENDKGTYAALCLIFRKGRRLKDRQLRSAALAAAGLGLKKELTAEALRYQTMFREDEQVRDIFIGILKNGEMYAVYGDMAEDFLREQKAPS